MMRADGSVAQRFTCVRSQALIAAVGGLATAAAPDTTGSAREAARELLTIGRLRFEKLRAAGRVARCSRLLQRSTRAKEPSE